ncbi:MAG: 2-iminobutanoate/2-iminopropanoate deaminase [Solirubrobacteraceae bacterium]|nr:2-iminobutanoate/2-iminopropanoate deaminase [Solirubrobacteraceae bacterium]
MISSWTFGPGDGVPPPVAPFAHATAAGETLYVTGQMPTGLDGGLVGGAIAEQTDQVMRNLARVLELVGGGLADVVMARAYLVDWDDYPAFNAAYERWFTDRLPSRTCVGTPGLAVGALVEVDLVAWRAGGWPGGVVSPR